MDGHEEGYSINEAMSDGGAPTDSHGTQKRDPSPPQGRRPLRLRAALQGVSDPLLLRLKGDSHKRFHVIETELRCRCARESRRVAQCRKVRIKLQSRACEWWY
jgi:hypothetical protein